MAESNQLFSKARRKRLVPATRGLMVNASLVSKRHEVLRQKSSSIDRGWALARAELSASR